MSNKNQSFMDSKTIFAIVLTMGIWFGWQSYLQKKYPDSFKSAPIAEKLDSPVEAGKPAAKGEQIAAGERKNDEIGSISPAPEVLTSFEDENWSFKVSSVGMGLRDIVLKKYTDRANQPVRIGKEVSGHLPFETRLIGIAAPLQFEVQKVAPDRWVGRARYDNMEITKTLEIVSSDYKIDIKVGATGTSNQFLGLSTSMAEEILPSTASLFSPQAEMHEVYVSAADSHDRIHITDDTEESKTFDKTTLASLGTQYFTQAIVDRSDILPELKLKLSAKDKSALATFSYPVLNKGAQYDLKFVAFLGPKSLHILKGVDDNLAAIVDFGIFSVLGRPILSTLKWFHEAIGNWGIAIILLTILVRFMVLPFNVMSFKSMKAMQEIQPQLKVLKEKYKNDQAKLNSETMALFKTHKVNPLGGCLPVVLQIPIFLALYQVLGHSIELYQAPFLFWIHDLSLKDPYYVLPVLMGITMFFQQKITPSTMDPAQAKILMFMPLIFTFFMVALPSGLTLYIFVSALFGIIQQLYLLKSHNSGLVTTK